MTVEDTSTVRARLAARIKADRETLAAIEQDIRERSERPSNASLEPLEDMHRPATKGQRLADAVARVGGSWPFVIGFFCFLATWMAINSVILLQEAFDPYPFILLNLVLSCLAAIQAPIIMMSQNRVSEVDRRRAEHDYRINLKAEHEVAALHLKVDHILHAQFDRMIELNETQLAILEELAKPSK